MGTKAERNQRLQEQQKPQNKNFYENYDQSLQSFFNSADEEFGLKNAKINENDLYIIQFLMKSKELKLTNLSGMNNFDAYFYLPLKDKYVAFHYNNFNLLMNKLNYSQSYIKKLYNELENKIPVELEAKKDADFLHNIKFKNGTLIWKDNKLEFVNEKYLSFNNIDAMIMSNQGFNPIKVKKLMDYLLKLNGNDKIKTKYFIEMISSILIPSHLITKIFWIKGDGGTGKSAFFNLLSHWLSGRENVSNLKIDSFVQNKSKPEYNLPYLNGMLLNFDDDYSGQEISNSGFLKQFISGQNKIQIDFKQRQPISFLPKAKLFVGTNQNPKFKTFDSGDKRRNIIFNWNADFPNSYDFSFLKEDPEYKNIFFSLLKQSAVKISEFVVKTNEDYFIKNIPDSVKKETDQSILTTNSDHIMKIENYLKDIKIDEYTFKMDDINYLNTKDLFKEEIKEFDTVNYKDFLNSLIEMEIIHSIAKRIKLPENGKIVMYQLIE